MYKRLQDTLPQSRKLGRVSDFAFRCWALAISQADWFGRLSADPDKFQITCFANRKGVLEDEIKYALDELADAGLIHLYRVDEGRFLVLHRHKEHNPTGGLKTRPRRCPPPPPRMCRCVEYKPDENPRSVKGCVFRFGVNLFAVEAKAEAPIPEPALVETEAAPVDDPEEGQLCKLTDEFTNLTGRPPLAGIMEPREFLDRLKGMIRVRGLDAMIAAMKSKTSDCIQRTGRPPSSLQYFVPIFEDDRVFNGSGGMNGGAQAIVGHFGLGAGKLQEGVERKIAERKGSGAPARAKG